MRIRFRRRREATVSVPNARSGDAAAAEPPKAEPTAIATAAGKSGRAGEPEPGAASPDLPARSLWASLPETTEAADLLQEDPRWAEVASDTYRAPAPARPADDLCGETTKSGRPCRWNVAARGPCLAHRRVDASR